jgi:hypothetical protein
MMSFEVLELLGERGVGKLEHREAGREIEGEELGSLGLRLLLLVVLLLGLVEAVWGTQHVAACGQEL